MTVTTTVKIKLYTDNAESKAFDAVCSAYSAACDRVSSYVFSTQQYNCSSQTIHKQLYVAVRNEFGLKSQMACSVFRTVKSAYDTVKTQLKSEPYVLKCEGKRYAFKRNLDWLQKPIHFKTPFCDLVRGRDWSFVTRDGEKLLSISTLDKRIIVKYNHHFDESLFADGVKHGGGKLLKRKGVWYLHISLTVETTDVNYKQVIGHDRGLRFIVTSYDGEKTSFVNGYNIAKKREAYHRTRMSLQKKNTRGSRRVLYRISGRENRWMSDVNHCLSKTLTKEPYTLHILEDLTDISFNKDNLKSKDQSRHLRSWAFYDLEQKMIYKAHQNQSEVIKVSASYTSQRCPKCGCIHRENRDHKNHLFVCVQCGYKSNDDRIGAMNLYEIGVRYFETGKLSGFSGQ